MFNQLLIIVHKTKYVIQKRFRRLEISSEDFGLQLFLLLLILVFGSNAITAYRKGVNNSIIIAEERAQLAQQQEQYDRAQEELEYYSSIEYKRRAARESQNLSEPGEQLYKVKRYEANESEFFEINNDPILLDDNADWWGELIFGR